MSGESTAHQAARIDRALQILHDRYRACGEGRVASYIPELTKADPNAFGIALVTIDGDVYRVGDCEQAFTIQSMSKPFTYALALEDRGREHVVSKVGVEPSGDSFDSIIRLNSANRPHNPMINSGAIATTSMVEAHDGCPRFERIRLMIGRCAGRSLEVDESVFRSEAETGHRNRAMAHLMQAFDGLGAGVDETLEAYFRQCSLLVTATDMAKAAAMLANAGVNPCTGERAIDPQFVRDVLSVMDTCGMYNYAGQWAYTVGVPAKSGVSGGIIAVLPGCFGICVYSPPVDERGNSVRGIRVCEDLSRTTGMHIYEATHRPGSILERIDRIAATTPELPSTEPPQSARHEADGPTPIGEE